MYDYIQKNVFLSETNASELVVLICLCSEENTCHWQSMC